MKPCVAKSRSVATTPTREELAGYMHLVHQVVGRMLCKLPPNVLRDDVAAAATFGLVDALRKSVDRGPAFDWYARIRIRGAVVDELRAQDWLTRRTRTRIGRARAQGESVGMAVLGFDDLPDSQAQGLVDEAAASPYEHVERRMNRAKLERALAQLPQREGNIVAWHYFDGIPFKTIALRLRVSEPRVSQLHSRAMGLLRAVLGAESAAA